MLLLPLPDGSNDEQTGGAALACSAMTASSRFPGTRAHKWGGCAAVRKAAWRRESLLRQQRQGQHIISACTCIVGMLCCAA